MSIIDLTLAEIYCDYFFCCKKRTYDDNDRLYESIKCNDIISPIIVCLVDEKWQCLDGLLRLNIAKDLGKVTIPVIVKNMDAISSLVFLYSCHALSIEKSCVSRLRVLKQAKKQLISRELLLLQVLPMLGIAGQSRLLKQCEKILTLPEAILDYCEEKNYSLKQCLRLAQYDPELILWLFSLKERINLSVSMLTELLDSLQVMILRQNLTLDALQTKSEINLILQANESSQVKTQKFRVYLAAIKSPLISQGNTTISTLVKQLEWPNNYELQWDNSLEMHQLKFSMTFKKGQEMTMVGQNLQSSQTQKILEKIFMEL